MDDITQIEGYYGVVGFEAPVSDYLAAAVPSFPMPRHTFNELKIQYYQPEVSATSCTEHGNIGSLSDNSGYKYTLDERKALWQQALALGASDSVGWYTNKACDLVRKDWNLKHPTDQVSTFVVGLTDDTFEALLSQGYSVTVSYYGNGAYNQDFIKDGVLDSTSFGVSTYGHCVRLTKGDGNTFNLIVDNYVTDPPSGYPNTYNIPMGHLPILVANKVFSPLGYIYVFDNDYTMMNNVSPWATNAWAKSLKDGFPQGDPKELITTTEIEIDLKRLGIVTQIDHNITRERWRVILDKLNLLK